MKISIKKKYVAGLAGLISLSFGFWIIQEYLLLLERKGFGFFLITTVSLFSTIYLILYLAEYKQNDKLIEEVAREITNNPDKKEALKQHLTRKTSEEAYSLTFLQGKIKLTSNRSDQKVIDKNKSR